MKKYEKPILYFGFNLIPNCKMCCNEVCKQKQYFHYDDCIMCRIENIEKQIIHSIKKI